MPDQTFDPDQIFISADTETTGLEVSQGERIIAMAAVRGSLRSGPIGEPLYIIVDTDGRQNSPDAFRVHGISTDDPRRKHEAIALEAFLDYIGDAPILFHNSAFDLGFFADAFKRRSIPQPKWTIIDTMLEARKRHPGQATSLDHLARVYKVDPALLALRKDKHDALLDSRIALEIWRGMNTNTDLLALAGSPQQQAERTDSSPPPASTGMFQRPTIVPAIDLDW